MINYSITVSSMYTDSSNPETPNLVTGIHVIVTGTDDVTGITASLGVYNRLSPGGTFVDFENLTPEIVSSWVDSTAMIEHAKVYLEKQIAEKRSNSSEGLVGTPWNVPLTKSIDAVSTSTVTSSFTFQDLNSSLNSQAYRNIEMEAAIQRVLTSIAGGTV